MEAIMLSGVFIMEQVFEVYNSVVNGYKEPTTPPNHAHVLQSKMPPLCIIGHGSSIYTLENHFC
jgi:hypothetical protein